MLVFGKRDAVSAYLVDLSLAMVILTTFGPEIDPLCVGCFRMRCKAWDHGPLVRTRFRIVAVLFIVAWLQMCWRLASNRIWCMEGHVAKVLEILQQLEWGGIPHLSVCDTAFLVHAVTAERTKSMPHASGG